LVEERSNGWRQRKITALPLDKLVHMLAANLLKTVDLGVLQA